MMRTTGAVRHFTDEPLPDDVLARILDNARFAPTGGNRQGCARRQIARTRNGDSPRNPLQPMQFLAEQLSAADQELDRVGVIAGASVYPFAWNVLLAVRNEGYGGVLTTMVVAEQPRVKELLAIPENYAVAAVLPLGKPARQVTRLTRNPVSEFATHERV